MLEVHFTKPNEKSHVAIGYGKTEDGSVFVTIDGSHDGYSASPSEPVEKSEREKSEILIAMFFYQEGSIKSLIEAGNKALQMLNGKEQDVIK